MTPFYFPAPAPLVRRIELLTGYRDHYRRLLKDAPPHSNLEAEYRRLVDDYERKIALARQALAKEERRA